ncbi:hypothetical protein L9F63_007957 [Diploptera punctata]|uniref:Uncharacterized protein n=1 Tax=Diploptera punctata TaxID=6984 RepID=A0AAD7Z758_DIPPU|nr:hypothetical protein L9F63_007957 [Diploptera punctata]
MSLVEKVLRGIKNIKDTRGSSINKIATYLEKRPKMFGIIRGNVALKVQKVLIQAEEDGLVAFKNGRFRIKRSRNVTVDCGTKKRRVVAIRKRSYRRGIRRTKIKSRRSCVSRKRKIGKCASKSRGRRGKTRCGRSRSRKRRRC